MVMKKLFLLFSLGLWFASCSTQGPISNVAETPPLQQPGLSLMELQNRLGLSLSLEDTSFREKMFDSCDLGTALNDLHVPISDCHHTHFAVAQFQLSCRPSEDSSQILNPEDLTPLHLKKLKWQIGKLSGEVQTDYLGRAVIRFISNVSVRKNYLRVSTGVDFLNVRLDQVTSIVTPPSWCQ